MGGKVSSLGKISSSVTLSTETARLLNPGLSERGSDEFWGDRLRSIVIWLLPFLSSKVIISGKDAILGSGEELLLAALEREHAEEDFASLGT